MKRFLSLLLSLATLLSMASFAVSAEDTAVAAGEAVTLPNTDKESVPKTGVQVWSGNVEFENSASAVTFVFRMTGVEEPIVATKVNPTVIETSGESYSWSESADKKNGGWEWNNIWGNIYAPEMTISEDGVYYLYLNRKVLADTKPLSIQQVTGFSIFNTEGSFPSSRAKPSNPNDNATFQMLAIVPNDLTATVQFYDGTTLLTSQSVAYTSYGNVSTGDTDSGVKDGINNRRAKQFGALVTPDDLFARQDTVPLPEKSKYIDGKLYRRVWRDEAGNVVDAVYKSGVLTLDYEEVDSSVAEVTFVDAQGEKIYTKTMNKDALSFTGEQPTKAADDDYTYTFAGWSVDGSTVVDLSTYKIDKSVLAVTFSPVFKSDLILKAELSGSDEISMGESETYQIKLNRTDVTTDVIAGTSTPITSGRVVISYPAAALSAPGQVVEGDTASVTVRFSSVSAGGIVGELELTALGGFAGSVTVTVSGLANKAIAQTVRKLTVAGQAPGYYIDKPETVKIANADGKSTVPKQTLWSGNVPFDSADAICFIYKTEGIDTEINAYQMSIGYNGGDTSYGQQKIWNGADTWGGAPSPRFHTFDANGYYALYINKRLLDDTPFTSVTNLSIFSTSTTYPANNEKDMPVNTNENATFTMLAVIGDAPKATVTFHDAQGEVIGEPYTHCYVDESSFSKSGGAYDKGAEMKQTVALLTPDDIFAEAKYAAPEKAADAQYTYTFAGWADENGVSVDAVYMNMDLYPVYEKTAIDPVKVNFVNGGASIADVVFPGAGHIEYTGVTPEKASEGEHSYRFRGWTTDPAKTLATSSSQAKEYIIDLSAKTVRELTAGDELTLYAVYEQTQRMWGLRFLSENDEEIAALYVLEGKIVNREGTEVSAPTAPEKAADAQYTYTPNGWNDKDGKQIISGDGKLTAQISADTELYPAYEKTLNACTVTFLDENGWTQIAKTTVNHGAAAEAPEDPSKAPTQYLSYTFAGWVDGDGNAADLSNITEDVTVYASYQSKYMNPFVDVKDGEWYSESVEYAVLGGIMSGTDKTHFSPNNVATRAQLVTVLWRMEGEPSAEGITNPFTDLGKTSEYYYNAVLWAYSTGLVYGVTDKEFKPNDQITREQFVTILYRYAKEIKGYYVGYGKASYNSYPDSSAVHSYAADAFRWAIATAEDLRTAGVDASLRYDKKAYISGVGASDGKTYLDPAGKATRAQMVAMLYRFLDSAHVDAPVETVTGMMLADASVYAVGDEYQICVAVKKECTMWVEIGGKCYYDHSNGILRSDKYLHKAIVPQDVLDAAGGYTVYLREIIQRKPYYTECGGIQTAEYTFRPLREKDHYNIINLADSHGLADAASASGSYFGTELDLLIMNGDIIDSSSNIDAFKTIYKISGAITKGQVPCIYSRGNHELRGLAAEQLADYTPTDNGKTYYTFRLGPVWGIVLDAGEDKADDNVEYGNTVACSAFRDEEEAFLNRVIASEEWGDATVKLVISHVPLVIKMSAPYNSEDARYAEWTRKIAAIEPTIWMTGHLHQCFFELPGERNNTFGYPCPLLCSSYKDSATNAHTCGAVTLTDDTITARYVTEKGEVTGERTIDRLR